MNLMSLLISIILALVFSSILVLGFNRRVAGPLRGMLFFFLIIFLFTWGIGSWLTPVGPAHWGVYWLGYLFIAVLIMLFLGMMLPPIRPRNRIIKKTEVDEEVQERKVTEAVSITFGSFFWLLLILLIALAIYKYVN